MPAWAKGLHWFLSSDMPIHAYRDQSWDFGLYADANPFKHLIQFYPNLFGRLSKRYSVLCELQEIEAETVSEYIDLMLLHLGLMRLNLTYDKDAQNSV